MYQPFESLIKPLIIVNLVYLCSTVKYIYACISQNLHHTEGRLHLELSPPSLQALEQELLDVKAGGHWSPSDCIPRQRLALIVPYKDRAVHLHVFLNHYHRMLQRQKIEYTIFVSEQVNALITLKMLCCLFLPFSITYYHCFLFVKLLFYILKI